MEPHLLGRDSADHDALCAYLIRGFTESGQKPYWRLYLLNKMEFVTVLDENFSGPRKGYNSRDKRMKKIYCCLPDA